MPRPFTAALALGLATLGLAAAPAYASVEPTPPPSGIVYHLFGPNSITSHILPSVPSAPATPGASPAAAGTASTGAQPAAPASPAPSWGDVAHQMFVTGDPAQEGAPQIPKGRAGE